MPKIYRVICYDGPEAWLVKQLDASIHGTKTFTKRLDGETVLSDCSITVATIDPEDGLSVWFARNKLQTLVAEISLQHDQHPDGCKCVYCSPVNP